MAMCIHCGQDDCDAGYLCPKAPRGLDQTPESPQYDKTQLEVCHLDSTFISANVEIRRPRIVRIGRHTNVDSGVYCTTALRLGDYVHLAAYCTIIGGPNGLFEMGHFSTLGAGSRIVCVSDAHPDGGLVGPRIPEALKDAKYVVAAPVRFEPMAIGTTQIIVLPGVTLGMGCFVGAGSLVTKDVPPWAVVVGTPAKVIRERSRASREKMLEAAKRLGYEWSRT
jgi:galactoside O-acetyltransferase